MLFFLSTVLVALLKGASGGEEGCQAGKGQTGQAQAGQGQARGRGRAEEDEEGQEEEDVRTAGMYVRTPAWVGRLRLAK